MSRRLPLLCRISVSNSGSKSNRPVFSLGWGIFEAVPEPRPVSLVYPDILLLGHRGDGNRAQTPAFTGAGPVTDRLRQRHGDRRCLRPYVERHNFLSVRPGGGGDPGERWSSELSPLKQIPFPGKQPGQLLLSGTPVAETAEGVAILLDGTWYLCWPKAADGTGQAR